MIKTLIGVKKIQYFLHYENEIDKWNDIPHVSLTGTLTETWSDKDAGNASTVTVNCELRGSSQLNDELLNKIRQYCYIYCVHDINGRAYILGTAENHATLLFTRTIDKSSVNGYTITITYTSPDGIAADV